MKEFVVAFENRNFQDGSPAIARLARVPTVGDFVQLPDKPQVAGRVNTVMLLCGAAPAVGLDVDALIVVTEVRWGPSFLEESKPRREGIKYMYPPEDLEQQIAGIDQ